MKHRCIYDLLLSALDQDDKTNQLTYRHWLAAVEARQVEGQEPSSNQGERFNFDCDSNA
jgi:hypothetical protein